MITRSATIDDIEQLHKMHMASIRDLCTSHYCESAIAAWSGRPCNMELRRKAIEEDVVRVPDVNGSIEGFFHVKPSGGSIEAVFVSSAVVGQGYGSKLLAEAILCLEESGCRVITLESTMNAFGFYAKHGFKRSGKNGQMRIEAEVIEYVPMSKKPAQQDARSDALTRAAQL